MLINSEYQATYLRLSETARASLDRVAEQESRLSVGDVLDPNLMEKLLSAATHLIEHNHDRTIIELMVIQAANFASREISESLLRKTKKGRKKHTWWTRKRDAELLQKYYAMVATNGAITNMAMEFAMANPTYDSPEKVERLAGETDKEWSARQGSIYVKQAKSIAKHLEQLLQAEAQCEKDACWRSDVNNIIASGLFSDLLD